MKYLLASLLALLSLHGCITVDVVDKRLTREEVAAALKQRDKAAAVTAQALSKVIADVKELKAEKTDDK